MTVISFSPKLVYSGIQTPGGATGQSHNRNIARTTQGLFYTAVHRGVAYGSYHASLWFWPNGSDRLSLVDTYGPYSGIAPAAQTDTLDNCYWGISNDATSTLLIRKYDSSLTLVAQQSYPGLTSTKWTMMFCEFFGLGSIMVASFSTNKFAIINRDLSLYSSYQITQNGTFGGLEYPFLAKSYPNIWLAGVTSYAGDTAPTYHTMHCAYNDFGGHDINWRNPFTGASLSLPIVFDPSGPLPNMRQSFTPAGDSVWLGGFNVVDHNRALFTYADPNGAAPVTETAFAYGGSPWGRTALCDNLLQGGAVNKVAGATLTIQEKRGSSAPIVKGSDGALYLIGPSLEADANGNSWLNILRSTDRMRSWEDYAQSDRTFSMYAINAIREGFESSSGAWTLGDQIAGIFTHLSTPGAACPQEVWAFRLSL